jgi:hypothetical protein
MARRVRKAPSVSERANFRASEAFAQDVEAILALVGTRTYDVPSISSGSTATFTITVSGCRVDQGQTVQVGLPSTFNTSLVLYGFVSADDTVTVVLYNPTGGAINMNEATYTARVMP